MRSFSMGIKMESILAIMAIVIGSCHCANPSFDTRSMNAGTKASSLMTTNIALVGADPGQTRTSDQQNVVIDPSNLVDQKALDEMADDIDEDDYDRFITTRTGKRRVIYRDEEENWAEEAGSAMGTPVGRPLTRVKRCGGGGGGGGDDDGGNANRSVSRRWGRRNVSRGRNVSRRRNVSSNRSNKKKKKKTTTVTTTKVISNGQVVSSTSSSSGQSTVPVVQSVAAAPQIVQHHQQPVVVSQIPQQQPVVVSQQQQPPVVVSQQAQPVVVSQQQQPVQAEVISAPAGQLPTVALSNSVNVNGGK